MWLESIDIKDFRNYQEQEIECNPHLNVFLGANAQGKTNILESIYFLALTRSHRTHSDKDLIHFQREQLHVKGSLHRSNTILPLEIILSKKGRTTKVNHLKQARLSDYIGKMNVILFAPEDLQLVKGSPAQRRKFIDIELGQIKAIYLSDLSTYNHVLKQRNSYLKTSEQIDHTFLDVLDQQLVDYGTRVIQHRINFVLQMEELAQLKHLDISDQAEVLTLRYLSSVPLGEGDSLHENYLKALKSSRSRDVFKRNTSIGPHRDDLAFYINGMEADYGSQGQQRSLILSLKLAEIDLVHQFTQEYPILLLDDVMSELDNNRQLKLLKTISKDIQTFITTTSLDHLQGLPDDLSIFTVKQGHIQSYKKA